MAKAENKAAEKSRPAAGTICNLQALRKATRRVSQLYDAMLAPTGLRSTQRAILVNVAGAGSLTMSELAAALVLDRSALNHNLKPLQRDGLLTVVVDQDDRRSRLVQLTRRGEEKLKETHAIWVQAQKRFESAYGSQEAAILRASLDIISSAGFSEAFALKRAV